MSFLRKLFPCFAKDEPAVVAHQAAKASVAPRAPVPDRAAAPAPDPIPNVQPEERIPAKETPMSTHEGARAQLRDARIHINAVLQHDLKRKARDGKPVVPGTLKDDVEAAVSLLEQVEAADVVSLTEAVLKQGATLAWAIQIDNDLQKNPRAPVSRFAPQRLYADETSNGAANGWYIAVYNAAKGLKAAGIKFKLTHDEAKRWGLN